MFDRVKSELSIVNRYVEGSAAVIWSDLTIGAAVSSVAGSDMSTGAEFLSQICRELQCC